MFHQADYAILDAVNTESTEGKGFSVHTLAGYLGFAAALVVAGTLGTTYGWRTALFVVGGIRPVYGIVTLLAFEPVYLEQLTERSGTATNTTRATVFECSSDRRRLSSSACFSLSRSPTRVFVFHRPALPRRLRTDGGSGQHRN